MSLFSVIEFDDMGRLLDRRQLASTYAALKAIHAHHPILLLMFVHGWKHSANEIDSNLQSFHAFVTNTARAHMKNDSANEYAVVGVYFGWRGNIFDFGPDDLQDVFPFQLPTALAYYNRDGAAKRVAGVTASEAILSLAGLAKAYSPSAITSWQEDPDSFFAAHDGIYDESKDSPRLPPDPLESRVVIAGHSMGGLIVERAVAQSLIGHMAINSAQYDAADLFMRDPKSGVAAARTNFYLSRDQFVQEQKHFEAANSNRAAAVSRIAHVRQKVALWRDLEDNDNRRRNELSEVLFTSTKLMLKTHNVLNELRTNLGRSSVEWTNPVPETITPNEPLTVLQSLARKLGEQDNALDQARLAAELIFARQEISEKVLNLKQLRQNMQLISTTNRKPPGVEKVIESLMNTNSVISNHREVEANLQPPEGWFTNERLKQEIKSSIRTWPSFLALVDQLVALLDKYEQRVSQRIGSRLELLDRQSASPLAVFGIEALGMAVVFAKNSLKEQNIQMDRISEKIRTWQKQLKEPSSQKLDALTALKDINCTNHLDSPKEAYACCDEKEKDLQGSQRKVEDEFASEKEKHEQAKNTLRNLASCLFIRSIMSETVPADLILLINPASSALVASQFTDALNNPAINLRLPTPGTNVNYDFHLPGNRPLIINMTSKGDSATGFVYPVAHRIASLTKSFPGGSFGHWGDEAIRFKHTAGHLPKMVTHRIMLNTNETASWNSRIQTSCQPGLSISRTNEYFLRLNLVYTNGWVSSTTNTHELVGDKIVTPKGVYTIAATTNAQSEYWVVDCARDLLPGHNQFWTPEFYATVGSLVRMRRLYDYDGPSPNHSLGTNTTPALVASPLSDH